MNGTMLKLAAGVVIVGLAGCHSHKALEKQLTDMQAQMGQMQSQLTAARQSADQASADARSASQAASDAQQMAGRAMTASQASDEKLNRAIRQAVAK
jgi:hypothetical protein